MLRPKALRLVALVADAHSFWNRTMKRGPHRAVSARALASHHRVAVVIRIAALEGAFLSASPDPAAIGIQPAAGSQSVVCVAIERDKLCLIRDARPIDPHIPQASEGARSPIGWSRMVRPRASSSRLDYARFSDAVKDSQVAVGKPAGPYVVNRIEGERQCALSKVGLWRRGVIPIAEAAPGHGNRSFTTTELSRQVGVAQRAGSNRVNIVKRERRRTCHEGCSAFQGSKRILSENPLE